MKGSIRFSLVFFLSVAGSAQDEPRPPSLPDRIDEAVRSPARLRADAVPLADDGEFLRRVMLDLVGHPPDLEEAKAFLGDADPKKREKKVDRLLASERFADLWARRFAEVYFGNYHDVRMDVGAGIEAADRKRIVNAFVIWLSAQLAKDRSYGQIVSEMLGASGRTGENLALAYKLSFFRKDGFALEVTTGLSRHFLGIDLYCARCHDHPFDKWGVEDFYDLLAFSVRHKTLIREEEGQRRVELVEIGAEVQGEEARAWIKELERAFPKRPLLRPRFFIGSGEPRPGEGLPAALARLLTDPRSAQFSRATVNHIWAWLLGRGIVHPVDDFNMRNRAVSPALLNLLAGEFDRDGRSIKALVRGICNSRTYQRSGADDAILGKIDFTRPVARPLTPEQLLNSVQVATLRSPRLDVAEAEALAVTLFRGRVKGCEVTPIPTTVNHLLWIRNSEEVGRWIRSGGLLEDLRAVPLGLGEKVDEMFLAALTRRPSDAERRRFMEFLEDGTAEQYEDAYWALLNSTEFLTRH